MNTEQNATKITILSSCVPDELFEVIYNPTDSFIAVGAIRHCVSYAAFKLDCEDPHIELIIKLFHRDAEFEDCFIKKISSDNDNYTIMIYKWVKSNNKIYRYNTRTDKKTNWKRFKLNFINSLECTNCCPICCDKRVSYIRCPTCCKIICEECLISQFVHSFKLKCPLCNIYLYEGGEEEQESVTKKMRETPVMFHREIAKAIIKELVHGEL